MNDVRKLVIVLIPSIAFVFGMGQLGLGLAESGPAASVREQYRIFLEQKAQAEKMMRSEMDKGALKACQEI